MEKYNNQIMINFKHQIHVDKHVDSIIMNIVSINVNKYVILVLVEIVIDFDLKIVIVVKIE